MTEAGGEGPMETTTAAVVAAAAAAGKKMPLPSSMLWVHHLRNYVGSGEGLGSEAQTG
jgi:ATP-dependent protease ClpP protease subunit